MLNTSNQANPGKSAFIVEMLEANGIQAVAKIIAQRCHKYPQCKKAMVAWGLNPESETKFGLGGEPPTPLTSQDLAWLRRASQCHDPVWSPDGKQVAFGLASSDGMAFSFEPKVGTDLAPLIDTLVAEIRLAARFFNRSMAWQETSQAMAKLEKAEAVQRALYDISELAASPVEFKEVLGGIHKIIGGLMYAENFFIVLFDPIERAIKFIYFADCIDEVPGRESGGIVSIDRLKNGLTWHLLHGGKPLMGTTEQLRQQIEGELNIYGEEQGDVLGVPMLDESGARGAIVVQSYDDTHRFSEEDKDLLQFVSSHVLTALERHQHKQELERKVIERTQELQAEVVERERAEKLQSALYQIAQLANEDLAEIQFYERIHQIIDDLINAPNFYVALVSEDRQYLEFPYFIDRIEKSKTRRLLGKGLSEYVINTGKPLRGTDSELSRLVESGDVVYGGPPSACWLGVPLFVGDKVIGLVAVQSYDDDDLYGKSDEELLGFVASQVANSLTRRKAALIQREAYAHLEYMVQERTSELRHQIAERERVQEQLHYQVMHDSLTNLPNRSNLRDRIEHAIDMAKHDPNWNFALLYLDIDRFKVINDSLGHLAGDTVLVEVAKRLKQSVPAPHVAARLSGDEFAVLMENIKNVREATDLAQNIIETLSRHLTVGSTVMEPSVSVGVAMGSGHYKNPDEILRDADSALYRAKHTGRKRYEVFTDAPQKPAVDALTLEIEIRSGLINNQFEPYFQPIVRLSDMHTMGYESLVRWNHPTRGVLGPMGFMKVAEESGNMEAIDWRVFETGCLLLNSLPAKDTFLTINVSPQHFEHDYFYDRLVEIIKKTGLGAGRLITEITEGSLLRDPDQVRSTLQRLKSIGVNAALDDFGTGYSSLSYLHAYPIGVIKIDKSFIAGIGGSSDHHSKTVIGGIIAMAHAMGMEVVAEGIETQVQLEALIGMGCDMGQGYFLGRPQPIDHWRASEGQV